MPHAPPRDPLGGLSRFLWRCALLAFWSFVLWGTLVDLGVAWQLVTGPADVLRVLFSRPKSAVGLAWGNRIAGLVAPFVWVLVLGALRAGARERSSSGTPGC